METKEALQEKLIELRRIELEELSEKLKALLDEYKVRLDCEFAYIGGQLKTNVVIKEI